MGVAYAERSELRELPAVFIGGYPIGYRDDIYPVLVREIYV